MILNVLSSLPLTISCLVLLYLTNDVIIIYSFCIFGHQNKNYSYTLQNRIKNRKYSIPILNDKMHKENFNYNNDKYDDDNKEKDKSLSTSSSSSSLFVPQLLKLASNHFASQALHAAIKLKIPDILLNDNNKDYYSINEISESIIKHHHHHDNHPTTTNINKDALLRTMRLLSIINIVIEKRLADNNNDYVICFKLTGLGKCFCSSTSSTATDNGFASCILHWMEKPLWDSWLYLPEYIIQNNSSSNSKSSSLEDATTTTKTPFEYANNGITTDEYYNKNDNPKSLNHANEFVKFIHEEEIHNIVNTVLFDWSVHCSNKKIIDIGGYNGALLRAILEKVPTIACAYCFDLPQVIQRVVALEEDNNDDIFKNNKNVINMTPGDVLQPQSIPKDCDVIIMKHFLDRCMWNDIETITILQTCSNLLVGGSSGEGGKIIIIDAVVPDSITGYDNDDDNRLKKENTLYLDAFYMLSGRERQRTESEWKQLALLSNLNVTDIQYTNIPTCSIVVMELKKKKE